MSGPVQCPVCLTTMAAEARFCPGCGSPRTWVRHQLEDEAARTGTAYATLLERARQGTLRLDEPQAAPQTVAQSSHALVAILLASLAVPFAIGFSLAGANWLVVAGLVVALAVLYATLQGRIDTLEARLRQLEARPVVAAVHETPEAPVAGAHAPERIVSEQPLGPRPEVTAPAAPSPLRAEAARRETPATGWATEASPPSAPPPTASAPRSIGDIEDLLSGRILAWVGGLAIFLGAVFFLSLAFSRGWIGPAGRVGIGVGASVLMLAAGGWFFERRERIVGHVLVAV
ncbi:MAG: DUF2339 domain-containing protein, partial [Thermomicrobiales bacterium]